MIETMNSNAIKGRRLSLDNPPDPATSLKELSDYAGSVPADKYMSGDLFDRLHDKVSGLLGKEAALYLPSGKLAQMASLKVLSERAQCSRIAMHPRSHFEEYEAHAYQELWGLTSAHLGGYDRLPGRDDLAAIHEPLGAVTLELPCRRLGCLLPDWSELNDITGLAREKGIFLHMDGARLWESQPFYDRPLAEIAGLFDTVYVALDKGLGALGGAVIAGPQWVIDGVKIWQRRAGGQALRSFPYVLSALKALEDRLPMMTVFHQKAKSVAATLSTIPQVSVSPNPPAANAFLVSTFGIPARALDARDQVAKDHDIWLFDQPVDAVDQSVVRFEVSIRMAGLELPEDEIRLAIEHFCACVKSA